MLEFCTLFDESNSSPEVNDEVREDVREASSENQPQSQEDTFSPPSISWQAYPNPLDSTLTEEPYLRDVYTRQRLYDRVQPTLQTFYEDLRLRDRLVDEHGRGGAESLLKEIPLRPPIHSPYTGRDEASENQTPDSERTDTTYPDLFNNPLYASAETGNPPCKRMKRGHEPRINCYPAATPEKVEYWIRSLDKLRREMRSRNSDDETLSAPENDAGEDGMIDQKKREETGNSPTLIKSMFRCRSTGVLLGQSQSRIACHRPGQQFSPEKRLTREERAQRLPRRKLEAEWEGSEDRLALKENFGPVNNLVQEEDATEEGDCHFDEEIPKLKKREDLWRHEAEKLGSETTYVEDPQLTTLARLVMGPFKPDIYSTHHSSVDESGDTALDRREEETIMRGIDSIIARMVLEAGDNDPWEDETEADPMENVDYSAESKDEYKNTHGVKASSECQNHLDRSSPSSFPEPFATRKAAHTAQSKPRISARQATVLSQTDVSNRHWRFTSPFKSTKVRNRIWGRASGRDTSTAKAKGSGEANPGSKGKIDANAGADTDATISDPDYNSDATVSDSEYDGDADSTDID